MIVKSLFILGLLVSSLQVNEEKTELLRLYSVRNHQDFQKVIHSLNEFTREQGKQKQNTFYVSKVRKERFTNQYVKGQITEVAYAYWVENQALIILSFPLADYDSWLKWHCYIDLKKDVVPKGSVENLGCCLVEDDWVQQQLRSCKKGDKFVLIKKQTVLKSLKTK